MSKKTKILPAQTITDRTIEEFFMTDYMAYSKYTISNRALPSIIDGLKPGARKIMHAAFSALSGSKEAKFFDVIGAAYTKSKYHHGDSSLISTILTLSAQHQDNLAPLEIIGTGGDLRSPGSAAPRYLELKLSQWAYLLEKDKHILEYNFDGDDKVEPKYYLPLLPLVLTARTQGMSIGYKYNSQISYNPADLVEQCINVLNTGHLKKKLQPHIVGFNGIFEQVDDRIKAHGRFTINKGVLIVTELPPNATFASFENNLIKLYETGAIQNWKNNSKDDDIKYTITVDSAKLGRQVEKGLHWKIYNLAEFLTRPTYTLLDEHDKIIIFKTPEEVLKYFVEFRLDTYTRLKAVNIENLNSRVAKVNEILKFLDLYFDDKIIIDKTISLSNIKAQLKTFKLPESVLETKFSKMTKEEYLKLSNEKNELLKELQLIQNTTTKELYLQELNSMLPQMKKSFVKQEFFIRETPKLT